MKYTAEKIMRAYPYVALDRSRSPYVPLRRSSSRFVAESAKNNTVASSWNNPIWARLYYCKT